MPLLIVVVLLPHTRARQTSEVPKVPFGLSSFLERRCRKLELEVELKIALKPPMIGALLCALTRLHVRVLKREQGGLLAKLASAEVGVFEAV